MEKNQRYEMRFRDVVGAYKGILKEKTALEGTLAALTGEGVPNSSIEAPEPGLRELVSPAAASSETETEEELGQTPLETPVTETVEGLRAKVRALSAALRVLTEEKNTAQGRFQVDKKLVAEQHRAALESMAQDHHVQVADLQAQAKNAMDERAAMRESLQGLTQQLLAGHEASSQREAGWENERRNHQEEIQALRKQLQDTEIYRVKIAEMELKLRKARDAELEALTTLNTGTEDLKARISQLQDELAAAKAEIQAVQTRGQGEEVLKLKQELRSVRKSLDHHREVSQTARVDLEQAVQAAQRKVDDTEQRIQTVLRQQEEKDAQYSRERMLQETRLTELSTLVGRYEKRRLEDGTTINELRQQTLDLNDELQQRGCDGSLGSQSNGLSSTAAAVYEEQVTALNDKVAKLKSLLYIANQRFAEATKVMLRGSPREPAKAVCVVGGREFCVYMCV